MGYLAKEFELNKVKIKAGANLSKPSQNSANITAMPNDIYFLDIADLDDRVICNREGLRLLRDKITDAMNGVFK